MNEQKFRVDFLDDAKKFLDNLDEKSREKIIYSIWKASSTNDKELFKKYKTKFGNLEQNTAKRITDFLPFGTKLINRIRL